MCEPPRKWIWPTSSGVSTVTCSLSPCMMRSNPSRIPSTWTSSRLARMVAALITLLMPGAGPPPTRMARLRCCVMPPPFRQSLIPEDPPRMRGRGSGLPAPADASAPGVPRHTAFLEVAMLDVAFLAGRLVFGGYFLYNGMITF